MVSKNYSIPDIEAVVAGAGQGDNYKDGKVLVRSVSFTEKNEIFSEPSHNLPQNNSPQLLLHVQNLCKSYEEGKPVLNNLCMSVKKGTIYGLLGSSGCGKTTLLNCVIGLNKWDSGQISLFGRTPNGSPGRKVGFMPQDVALYDQITIPEMMHYYGKMYGMNKKDIEIKWNWLRDFLQLPLSFKLIRDLSGGQKRRASLSLCLLHSPELLILDEPTVGLDPVLRESIWQHLLKMVSIDKTTVIVTTHYIEETKQSNMIGVMRNGRLLVEDSPVALLRKYNCDLLEDVVLKLCHTDESLLKSYDSKALTSNNNDMSSLAIGPSVRQNRLNTKDDSVSYSSIWDRTKCFSMVIGLIFWRNPVFMIMILFLPTIQILITLGIVGTHPKNLAFGVVNGDTVQFDHCFNKNSNLNISNSNVTTISVDVQSGSACNLVDLSCILINELMQSGVMSFTPVKNIELGQTLVHSGTLMGYFDFPQNYSQHITDLVMQNRFSENDTLDGSRVKLSMDWSHSVANMFVVRETLDAYFRFATKIATECGMDPKEVDLPLIYREPVFGSDGATIQDYMIPVVVIMVLFELPMLITPVLFINDRKQGTLDRARVAGLHFKEVMLAHFITQGSVIVSQTAICFVVMILVSSFEVAGSIPLYFVLCVLGGLCGESFGLMLGVLCRDEVEAVMAGIFVGPILLVMAGLLWPLEMMWTPVKWAAESSPTTLFIASIRAVVYKGVGITHPLVWPGIVICIAWTGIFWAVSSIIFFITKHK